MTTYTKFAKGRPLRVRVYARSRLDFTFWTADDVDPAQIPPAGLTEPVNFTDWQDFGATFADMQRNIVFQLGAGFLGNVERVAPFTDGGLRVWAPSTYTGLLQDTALHVGRFDVWGVDGSGSRHTIRNGFWGAVYTVSP